MNNMSNGDYHTVDDISTLLKISKATVFRLLDRGELSAYKIGGQWRISPEQLKKFLKERETNRRAI